MDSFLIQKTPKGFTFILRAANGQTVAVSECYHTEAACRSGVHSVRANALAPVEDLTAGDPKQPNPKYQLYRDKRGDYRFRLKARNGRIIAVSDGYRSKAACLDGIESIRSNVQRQEAEA